MTDKFERLPKFAKPENYKIHLEPELVNFTCNGRVDILLNVTEAIDFIKLHSACREIRSAKLALENGKEWVELKFESDKKWKTVVVRLPDKLQPQKVTLTIEFETEINAGLNGFYRSSYKDKEGNQKFMASTQFESEAARLCFPCFDEPEFKAVFDCELLVDEHLTALSNMNVVAEERQGGKKLVKFATTPIMSTYLIAFAVGEFEYIETTFGNNIPFRIYTTLGKKEQTRFSLEIGKKAIEYFNDWFGFESPLPKIDMLAVPDFAMGAMENWGLVTYREIYMCHDDQTTHMIRNRSAMVIFHELAHFWFGNLVTMQWWGELWLKEGFASFCQYVLMNNVCPEFKILLEYLPEIVNGGMKADEILSSHPIEIKIDAPSDLESYYDAITYHKSNAVIRMLYNYLGNETFKQGLRAYIKKHAYSNTTTQDLWSALSQASNQNINEIMDTWTKQMGFPLVIVEDEKLEGKKRLLRLKQTRFLSDGSTDNQVWQIPLTFTKSSSPNNPFHKFVFSQFEQEIVLDDVDENEWIKVNHATSGFYRVQYSRSMLDALLKAIKSNELDVKDRFGLASDLLALTECGRIPAFQFLAFFAELTNEDEYIIWQVVIGGVLKFSTLLDHYAPDLKVKFDKFAAEILEPVAKRLTWDFEKGEDAHRAVLRSLVLGALVRFEHADTVQRTWKLFDEYKSGNTKAVHPELRKMVFNVAAKRSSEYTEYFLNLYKNCNNNELERDCLLALSRTENEDQRKEIFDQGITGQGFRAQDLMFLFASASVSAKDQEFIWTWFKNNYKHLIARFDGKASSIACANCFKVATSSHCTERFAQEFESFFNSIDEDTRDCWNIRFNQSLENIRNNVKFYQKQHGSIGEFLASH